MIAPCKDCTSRFPSCHDKCEKYKMYYEWNEKRKEAKRNEYYWKKVKKW